MKKILVMCCAFLLALSFAGCEKKIETTDATDTQKNSVIEAAKTFYASDAFKGYVELFETTFAQEANQPEIQVAFTFQHDDVQGFAYDLILFNIKADVAQMNNNEVIGYDAIQVIIDTKSGIAYDSLTYSEECLNFNGQFKTYEDGFYNFLNSGVLMTGNDDYLWADNEISTRFTKADIKEINDALK